MLHELNIATIFHYRKVQTNGIDIPTQRDSFKNSCQLDINSWRLSIPVTEDVLILVME